MERLWETTGKVQEGTQEASLPFTTHTVPVSQEGPIPTPAKSPITGLAQHSPSDFLDQPPGVPMEESPPCILSTKNFQVTQFPHRRDKSVSDKSLTFYLLQASEIIWDCW